MWSQFAAYDVTRPIRPWLCGFAVRFACDCRRLARHRIETVTEHIPDIPTGGENVYPAEVELALEACPGVRRALVFGIPDERWGQIVAAAIEINPGTDAGRDYAQAVASMLAPHKRPRRVWVVGALPVNRSGKLDRAEAAARFGSMWGGAGNATGISDP